MRLRQWRNTSHQRQLSFGHWNFMGIGHVCAKGGHATVDRTLKSQEQGISDNLMGTCLIVGHMASLGCCLAQFRFGLFPTRDSHAELLSSMRTDQK